MDTPTDNHSHALDGRIVPTFYRYLIPSMVGLIAMSSATIVDGIFIGNFVGVPALAAVNLLMPFMALMFGVGLMLSVGGSVRGGKYLGEKNTAAASAIFSKTLIAVIGYGVVVIIIGLVFETYLFRALGAKPMLFALMSEYFRITLPFLIPQLGTIVLYFFIRLDGFPTLTALALVLGSVLNIALDALFVGLFGWGLAGAAWATGIAQLLPFLVLLTYFFSAKRNLRFQVKQAQWKEVFQAAYNGASEFINEISGGVIAFLFNWMLIQRAGVEGVAAITVVNYLLVLGFMVFFSIGDTIQVMVSQNFGAKNSKRIQQFLSIALFNAVLVSACCLIVLSNFSAPLVGLFIDEQGSAETLALATLFIGYIWPVFIFAGINMLISGYLTAIHFAFQSGVVALCRSLILPACFLLSFYFIFADYRFVSALTVAEAVTFLIALGFFLAHTPKKVIASIAP